jgi:hypothetical protein
MPKSTRRTVTILSPPHANICTRDLTPAHIKEMAPSLLFPGIGPLSRDHRNQATLRWLGLKIPRGSALRVGSSPTSGTIPSRVIIYSSPLHVSLAQSDLRLKYSFLERQTMMAHRSDGRWCERSRSCLGRPQAAASAVGNGSLSLAGEACYSGFGRHTPASALSSPEEYHLRRLVS